jgi:hypothetical protein
MGQAGSNAVADSLDDADATHTAGSTVVIASKSLKQIFSEESNSAAKEKSGKNRAVYTFSLTFSERRL